MSIDQLVISIRKDCIFKMSKKLSGLMIILAGCLWGTLGLFVRRFNTYGVESMSIVFLRSLLTGSVTLGAAALLNPKNLRVKAADILIFAGTGLLSIVFFNYCYFTAISMMSLSAAAILLYTSPVFVMLMSAVFFKEKITLRKTFSIILSVAGLVFVTGAGSSDSEITLMGVLFGIGSAFGYALYSIFSRAAINRGIGTLTFTGWSFVFAALFSVFFADTSSIGAMISQSRFMLLYSLIFAVTASILPYIFYTLGLKGTENGKAAVIVSIEPVAATVFGLIIYGEFPSLSAVIGFMLVIAAVVMSAV